MSGGEWFVHLCVEAGPLKKHLFISDYIVLLSFVMKKRSLSSHGSDKSNEGPPKKDKQFITFDYQNNLQCFITSNEQASSATTIKNLKKQRRLKTNPSLTHSQSHDKQLLFAQLRVPRKNRGKIVTNLKNAFTNSLLLLEYQEQQAKPTQKVQSTQRFKDSTTEEEDQVVTAVVNSCLRVITEDTEHSSNPISARYTPEGYSTPTGMTMGMQQQMVMPYNSQEYYYYMLKSPAVRNRRAISTQESKAFLIQSSKVQGDGRTTIMVRNIPNKYTQDMLLELFEKNHKKKFDFFYLPIDYNNNCNVGYAFLNFIHTKFIVDFYKEFHQRKWNKFNSVKVCQVCYARIQGTAQLQHHFEHSNVIQQRQKRFRPLIGLKSFHDNISSLVAKQKNQHATGTEQPEK